MRRILSEFDALKDSKALAPRHVSLYVAADAANDADVPGLLVDHLAGQTWWVTVTGEAPSLSPFWFHATAPRDDDPALDEWRPADGAVGSVGRADALAGGPRILCRIPQGDGPPTVRSYVRVAANADGILWLLPDNEVLSALVEDTQWAYYLLGFLPLAVARGWDIESWLGTFEEDPTEVIYGTKSSNWYGFAHVVHMTHMVMERCHRHTATPPVGALPVPAWCRMHGRLVHGLVNSLAATCHLDAHMEEMGAVVAGGHSIYATATTADALAQHPLTKIFDPVVGGRRQAATSVVDWLARFTDFTPLDLPTSMLNVDLGHSALSVRGVTCTARVRPMVDTLSLSDGLVANPRFELAGTSFFCPTSVKWGSPSPIIHALEGLSDADLLLYWIGHVQLALTSTGVVRLGPFGVGQTPWGKPQSDTLSAMKVGFNVRSLGDHILPMLNSLTTGEQDAVTDALAALSDIERERLRAFCEINTTGNSLYPWGLAKHRTTAQAEARVNQIEARLRLWADEQAAVLGPATLASMRRIGTIVTIQNWVKWKCPFGVCL